MAKFSVLRSIRSFCLECQGGSSVQVKECTDNKCMLREYRFGYSDLAQNSEIKDCIGVTQNNESKDFMGEAHFSERKIFIRSALRSIRRNCMNCASSREDVRKCTGRDICVLWTYRFGVSPKKYKDVRIRYFAPQKISLFS